MPDDGSRRTKPKILVLNNENPAWPEVDLLIGREMLQLLLDSLGEQGYVYEPYVFFDDLSGLERYSPKEWLVWNWGEELAGRPWSEAEVAEALEGYGFIYTGSPPAAFHLVQDRARIKQCLVAAGLPTLPWRVFSETAQADEWQQFPAIVKGANQHASYGIDRNAVVANSAELAERIRWLREQLNDVALVEPFLDSREFQVAVWGNADPQALPPVELDYSIFSDARDRLYTYDWKFDHQSRGYTDMKMPCPAPRDRPDWQARLMELAVATYRLVGLRDYGRLDIRMLGDEPQILDVNANPDLDNFVSVLPIGAKALGLSYAETIDRIISFAQERFPPA